MSLLEIFKKSAYGTIGYVSSIQDLQNLEGYIVHNLPILREFPVVIVATNYKDYPNLAEENRILWSKYLPGCILLDSKVNKGHNFGTAELDNMIFDYCKQSNIEWLCKSANDVILTAGVLSVEVGDSDFYYFNGLGVGGIHHMYKADLVKAMREDFFPQTNFYILNVGKCDYLNNKEHIQEVYNKTKADPLYNGNPYDYGFSACEEQLKHCVYRNNLKKERLVSDEKYMLLLQCILNYQIHDPSHKNIMINGVCHYHYKDQQVLEIPNI